MSALTMTMLILSTIVGIYILPVIAAYGLPLIFYFLLALLFFLLPLALVCAHLSDIASGENQGGFHWIRLSLGEKIALLAIWLQWINTLIWFPTFLAFIAATGIYIFVPQAAENKNYLVVFMLILFLALTFINLFGIKISGWITTFCQIIGVIIPLLFIMCLGLSWVILKHKAEINLQWSSALLSLTHSHNWPAMSS